MYTPETFLPTDEQTDEFLRNISAAHLVTSTPNGLVSTFLPFLFRGEAGTRGSLVSHMARNNDHWKMTSTSDSLVIVTANDSYVSPSWYPSKMEHGRVVPTYNYMIAHVFGELIVHDDINWLNRQVRELSDRFESGRDIPWKVDEAPEKYVQGQLSAIVGLEIVIKKVEAKFKMSQNRPSADIDGVIAGLANDGLIEQSKAVEELRPSDK
ncbi:MAG: FMN-binding negative transcriptional regulator [Actinomycetes bacterium]